MIKTPMQELLDELRKSPIMNAVAMITIEQLESFKKERKAIEGAFEDGIDNECLGGNVQGDEYYTTKYGKDEG